MQDYFSLFLGDFRGSVKSFNRMLSIGIIFTLFGHFYIMEPYFNYGTEKQKLESTQSQLEKEHKALDKDLADVRKSLGEIDESLEGIKKEIRNFPSRLRGAIKEIEKIMLSPGSGSDLATQGAPRLVDGKNLPVNIKSVKDGVKWYMKQWADDILQRVQEELTAPVIKLKNEIKMLDEKNFEGLVRQRVEKFRIYLDAAVGRDFWEHYRGKVAVSGEMEEKFQNQFLQIPEKINEMLGNIKKEELARRAELKNKKQDIDDLDKKTHALESRIQSTESPIGKLPLKLPDFIRLFPVIMVILCVMLAFQLRKTKRIQRSLSGEIEKSDTPDDRFHRPYFVDCWFLPPYRNGFQSMILKGVFFICFSVFLRSIRLIIKDAGLSASLTLKPLSFNNGIFLFSYIIGVLVILGCFWSIWKETGKSE